MTGTVAHIVRILDRLAPPRLAESWDNVGLQLGNSTWPVHKVWTALDPLPEVVARACENDVDVLVTHHPLFFKPVQRIDCGTPLGRIVERALTSKLAIFSAHTNLDSVTGGLNDILAQRIGLKDLTPLATGRQIKESISGDPEPGIGRVGRLDSATELKTLVRSIKKKMGLKTIKFAGDPDLLIKKAAICTGSGSSLIAQFFESGAQVYISGDMRYHDARDIEAAKLGVIDIGHFASECFIGQDLAVKLRNQFDESGIDVSVEACEIEKDPFEVL